jgi:predicted nucleotidyltransferase component of viral defense system
MSNEPPAQWYHDDATRFRDALAFTEANSGFTSRLIEKDYYCSLLLTELYVGLSQNHLVFKGGTCLSKVHADFFRLSEDLDFAIAIRHDASRSDRRQAVAPIKNQFSDVPTHLPCFEITDALAAHDQSRQYNGRLSYRSAVTGELEFIKIEVSLRELHALPPVILPARTLLRDPHSGQDVLPAMPVPVLQRHEAYAEKIRAALTRREAAIRDFFDLDHAIQAAVLQPFDRALLDLVNIKLEVPGNGNVDLSDDKIAALRAQIASQLRPVLRPAESDLFELGRVVLILQEIMRLAKTKTSS